MAVLERVLDEKKIKRLILYFVFFYFVTSQWHGFFWHKGGKYLLGDALNFLWIPAILYALLWIRTRKFPLRTPDTFLEKLLIILVAYVALQFLWATDADEHLSFFVMLIQLYFAYWFITSALGTEKEIKELLILVMITQSILAFISLAISFANADNRLIRPLLFALGGTSSALGMSLILSLSFALPLLSSEDRIFRLLSFIVVALVPAAIVGTTSRAPTIAAFVPFILAFPFLLLHSRFKMTLLVAYTLALGLSFIIYTQIYSERGFLVPAKEKPDTALAKVDGSFAGRRPNWEDALSDIEESPFWGHGAVRKDYGGRGPHPHNDVLLTLCRFGMVGTAIVAAMLITLFVYAGRLRKSKKHLHRAVAVSTAIFITANALYFIPECIILLYFRLSLLYVFFLAVFTAVYRLQIESDSKIREGLS